MSKSKTQIDIVKDFLEGSTEGVSGGSGNLKIKGNQLVHYRTPIAERLDDKFIVNITRYSLQTGRIQKILRLEIPQEKYIEVKRVPEGFGGSIRDFLPE